MENADLYISDNAQNCFDGCSLVSYGLGQSEAVTWAKLDYPHNSSGKQREASTKEEMSENSITASNCRAKKNVRQKIATISADRMLTFTYRGAQLSLETIWEDFKVFLKYLNRLGVKLKYVVVAEKHKSGGYHLHLASSGFISLRLLRQAWQKAITRGTGQTDFSGENSPGNVQMAFQKNGSNRWRPVKLAVYLSKYVTKDLDAVEIGRHRYRCSIGIKINKQVFYFEPVLGGGDKLSHYQRIIQTLIGNQFQSIFEYKENYYWFATWEPPRYVDERRFDQLVTN